MPLTFAYMNSLFPRRVGTKILSEWVWNWGQNKVSDLPLALSHPQAAEQVSKVTENAASVHGFDIGSGVEAFGPKWATKHLRIFLLRCRDAADPLDWCSMTPFFSSKLICQHLLQPDPIAYLKHLNVSSGVFWKPWQQYQWLHRCFQHWSPNQPYQAKCQQLVCNWFQNQGAGITMLVWDVCMFLS